jgi:hypothetical protein
MSRLLSDAKYIEATKMSNQTSTEKYARAMFLKERALEMVRRSGRFIRIHNRGFALECTLGSVRIFYADPESSQCDELYHLDVHAEGSGKVFDIAWKTNALPLVITFKRGAWEGFYLS